MNRNLDAYNKVMEARNILQDKGQIAAMKFVDSLDDTVMFNAMIAYIAAHGEEEVRKEMIKKYAH